MYYHKKYKNIKKSFRNCIVRSCAATKNCIRILHPWLAGAQYWTTAVVLVYRLISLIGPHCPASTYSSTCLFSVYASLCTAERKRKRKYRRGTRRREKERKGISYVHACVLTVVGAWQSVHYLRNIYLVITSTIPYTTEICTLTSIVY